MKVSVTGARTHAVDGTMTIVDGFHEFIAVGECWIGDILVLKLCGVG